MITEQVAVIILNYKSWEDTLKEAQMIHDLYNLEWHQVIIIDNASPNDSEEKLKEKIIGEYVFIESGKNTGYAAGNNIGLRYAYNNGYKYGWILNNDIIIDDPSFLSEVLRVFHEDPMIAVVNPDIYSPEGYQFNRDSKRPSFYDMTIGMNSYRWKGRQLDDLGGYGYIYRPQGCCMVLDLEKGNSVGFLDETTFLYCEEPIYAERLLVKGWKCACLSMARVIHNHSKTVKTSIGKWEVIKTQNRSFNYYLKEYRGYGVIKRFICLLFYSAKNYITN